ncbi:MAG: type I restriction-modification enzyme R subunit C-terminal domain-containing protein [Rubrivivax sp.]|nr:type I restriction-modification enzyme R subunit C-terminal domain-containing protein [Rubrivivax sp.]
MRLQPEFPDQDLLDEGTLWQAYAALDKSKVKGASRRRILTDLVSLVRFAMQQDNELVPYPERVAANFKAWLAQQTSPPLPGGERAGVRGESRFNAEQVRWLEMIRDHIAASLGIEIDDFDLPPFSQQGGRGKVHQLFGAELPTALASLTASLAA